MKNLGKVFEQCIQKSVPNYVWVHRLQDNAQSFGGSSNLRFSRKNPFDYLMFDSQNRILYALELKTVQGKSISFEKNKSQKGVIHYHQIEGLNMCCKYRNFKSGFLIEFRELEKTVFIDIREFNKLIDSISKKSFCFSDLDEHDIRYIVIPQTKLRTRYKYKMNILFELEEKENE